MARFEGFVEKNTLPVHPGDMVTIRKGTVVKSTHPGKHSTVAKKTYKVKVHHILEGYSERGYEYYEDDKGVRQVREFTKPIHNPSVRWVGQAHYWFEVDVNDLPEVTG